MFQSPKWILSVFLLFFFSFSSYEAPAQKSYRVFFYNVENLFDTSNDSLTRDDDYTPMGPNHWTRERFNEKLRMIYKAILIGCRGNFPDVIGLAEVENRRVLEQLILQTPLKNFSYGILHKESADLRGIDVGLLYRKDRILPLDLNFFEVSKQGKDAFTSRDILYFKGAIEGTVVHFFVNHWPSKSEGYLESKSKRNLAAHILRMKVDSILMLEKDANILIMGDFNATPREESLSGILKAVVKPKSSANSSLINLSSGWLKKGEGTIYRAGQWEIFDQFICSANLLRNESLTINQDSISICNLPFLLERDNNYLKYKPFRTYLGPVYHGGISDHLPIVALILKN